MYYQTVCYGMLRLHFVSHLTRVCFVPILVTVLTVYSLKILDMRGSV